MKTLMILRLRPLTIVITICLLVAVTGSAQTQFVLYDNFTSRSIDPDKWVGGSLEGTPTAPTAEVVRSAQSRYLLLSLVSWGGTTSDTGTATSLQLLGVTQLGIPGGSGSITGLRSKVTVSDALVEDCAANPGVSVGSARVEGQFFNDGSGTGGDIRALVELQRLSNGVNRISAALLSGSTLLPVTGNPAIFTTSWQPGKGKILEVAWDQTNSLFTYTVTDPTTSASESKDIAYLGLVTDTDPPLADFKGLRVQNGVENCSATRTRVAMDARFDDVELRRLP